jgi:two-component sensor histidine kinase
MTDLAAGAGDSIFISSFHGVHYFNASSPAPALNRFNPDGDGIRGRTEQLQADLKRNIWAMASDDLHMLEFRSRRIYRLAYEVLRKEPKLLLNLNDINGDIMLGSWKYVFLVKNDSNLLSRERLPVYITAIRTGSSFAPCGPFGFTGSRITLPYSDNSFTVEYTAVNFRAGSSNLYACKMEGLEEEWNFTGNESVSYKLPPGKYSFRLRAANASGLWDETFVFTDIVIRPPFYRTWWFGILVALLFTSVIYITYRYRINQLLKLQKMRDNISRDLHDDIGSSLTNIAIMNELAVQETRRGGDTEKILQRSAEDIHEVISSLSDIVWNVNPEYDDLKYLLARMRRYALDLLDSTEIVCRIEIMDLEEKISMNMEQRRDLYMIFKEGLNNLVKYSGAHKAEVFIGVENQSVRMAIIDDGKGFKPESVLYGNGLKNMRQRTHLWNGIFRIISAPGKGTELHFIIPIKN